MKQIMLVYMAAGLSSRFGGKPKMLARVGPKNETLMECALAQAREAGISKVTIVVSKKTQDSIKSIIGNTYQGMPITYALQDYDEQTRDKPWGTLDAVCAARSTIDSAFIACNGDDIYGKETFKQLVRHLQENTTNATIGYKLKDVLSNKGPVNRGIYKVGSNNKLLGITETRNITQENLSALGLAEDDLCSMNIFAFQKEVIAQLEQRLVRFKQLNAHERAKESLLPEEVTALIEEGMHVHIYPPIETWHGLTVPEDEEIVRQALQKNNL